MQEHTCMSSLFARYEPYVSPDVVAVSCILIIHIDYFVLSLEDCTGAFREEASSLNVCMHVQSSEANLTKKTFKPAEI